MIETPIITREELQNYKQFSKSGKNDKLNQIILEAQIQDLMPLLGERLFNAVLKDVKNAGTTYTSLLDGGEFTHGGVTYYHAGLKAVLSNYVYGRNIMWGDVIDNPFGATRKRNPNSEPVDYATKKSFYQENKEFAFNLWLPVRRFLILTKEPLFMSNCKAPKRGLRLRKIG